MASDKSIVCPSFSLTCNKLAKKGAKDMENIGQILARGLIAGAVIAAAFAGFAGFLYLLYRLVKHMRPKEVRQEERRILSHRLYRVSGRGRAAYLILCLENALKFYHQDFAAWEWVLGRLWSITELSESGWLDIWLDSVGELMPDAVLAGGDGSGSEEAGRAHLLYTQAGSGMIVINAILDSLYTMVCEWSPDTAAHNPDGLCRIGEAEETMKRFGVPLPSDEMIRPLLGQRSASFGEAFEWTHISRLSKR